MATSTIEWTEKTWNPTTGCTKVSQGCKNCYAETMHKRLRAMGCGKYAQPFSKVVCHPGELGTPRRWKKPCTIFVNSMSDLFHDDVPAKFIQAVFKTMNKCPQHTFQVLTKRPERAVVLNRILEWTQNIWLGTSVENLETAHRTASLVYTYAAVKFLSCEPLLGSLAEADFTGIDWVIVGGESGAKARPMKEEWVEEIWAKCKKADIPFFFKQWGGRNKKAAGRLFLGQEWNEMPMATKPLIFQE